MIKTMTTSSSPDCCLRSVTDLEYLNSLLRFDMNLQLDGLIEIGLTVGITERRTERGNNKL